MKLSANRVVLILHSVFVVLTAVGLFLAAVNGSLPKKWQETMAVAIGIVGALAAGTVAVIKFLDGSQKSEALQANRPTVVYAPAALNTDEGHTTPEVAEAWRQTHYGVSA